jgi:alcohol dehydrogenase (NADP+)
MLNFAVEKSIKLWVQKWGMDDINKAMPAFKEGKPRYRFVLVNTDNRGKL